MQEEHTLDQKSSQCAVAPPEFDYALIRSLKPFPAWLEGEMRSNHAGETGAVNIYAGAKWALETRRSLSRQDCSLISTFLSCTAESYDLLLQ